MAAVPLLQGFFRVLGEVPLVPIGGDLAPRGGVVQHEAHALRRSGKRGVYRRGEGVDEVGVARGVQPQEAAAQLAEVALHLARRNLVGLPAVAEPGVVDGEVLTALDLQGVRVGAEVDGVASAAGRLAADGAVAGLIRVGSPRSTL